MTSTPEDVLDQHLPDPPQTKKPLSFLEWASAGLGIAALFAEMLRRIFPTTQDGLGFIVVHTIIVVALGLVFIQGLPILFQEIVSNRRGTADYYMLSLFIFCLVGSGVEIQENMQNHFLGILPVLFAGYAISKRKYRNYQEGLELASESLKTGGPALEVLKESEGIESVKIESVKTGDLVRIKTGSRIWVPGIIHNGFGLLNQASPQSNPVPRRCGKGDSVNLGEVVIEGDLIIQATENGKALPQPKETNPDSWLEQFHQLTFNRRQNLLRISWISFTAFITTAQITYSHMQGDWTNGLLPALSLLIGLNPWGIVLILPLLWRRRFTVTAYKGIRFRNLKVVEMFSRQLEVVLEKTGILAEPGISKKSIILSKHFQGKSPFIIRAIRAMEEEAKISLGAHYFSMDPKKSKVRVKQLLRSDKGAIEAEIFDEEEHRIFIRVGSLRAMPYFTHNGFKQLNAQLGEVPPRQLLFVTLNDIPAAIFTWDERIKDSGQVFLDQATAYGLPLRILTRDPRSKLESFGVYPVEKVASAEEKKQIVEQIHTAKKHTLYLGFGRNDVPALSTASASMVMENSDPFALPFADAVLTNHGLELLVGEWLRFKKTRSIAKTITLVAVLQASVSLLLTFTQTLNPWLATFITGITGIVMLVQTLQVEKD